MMRFIGQEWKFFIIVVLSITVLSIVYYEYRQFMQYYKERQAVPVQPAITINTSGEVSKPGEPQAVYLKGDNTYTKEIVYIPKETDPKTKEPEKTDVEFERKQGRIVVKVNGKEFEVPAEVKEEFKFEKGKLFVSEQTEMRINITAPKPALNLGAGWSLNGPALQANGPVHKNVSWWLYGDRKTIAGGVQFPIMK